MSIKEIVDFHGGVVAISSYKSLRTGWSQAVRKGSLVKALPGIVMDPGLEGDGGAWIRAVNLWDPNAAIAGRAAAALSFDATTDVSDVVVYTSRRVEDRGLLRFRRHQIPAEHLEWTGDFRITNPSATALTAGLDGDFQTATTALRLGLVSVASLTALAGQWAPGRPRPAQKVAEALSRNPWSVAELEAHRLLRDHGITGWVGNLRVTLAGKEWVLDIALEDARIAFEINSFEFHSSKEAMERDAVKANALAAGGWRCYVLTPRQIRDNPEEATDLIRRVIWKRHQAKPRNIRKR
ncbi:hypothetical protein LKO27_01445 [Tessaracoccus sp. OS52]|uniref:endonuclease domain-containing protein n=1 Tax=Tessaracoccus sp. OS52 TaxID=2886691 RepID=UPI001D12D805|nr:hypothetical protein [Tessaracoccus sp. OS52]MCC2592093.1 hypothetical protein [Tessaracoccus sp. OS52]